LNFLGKMDITIGVILHEGSTILVILNALRMLKTPKKYL
jgi:Cd2+/Zn2+-exporting ATPase